MYIVIELQTNADGTVGSIVNNFASRYDAESRYHQILAAAAVSQVPTHAAAMMSAEGYPLMHACYKHTPVPETDESEGFDG